MKRRKLGYLLPLCLVFFITACSEEQPKEAKKAETSVKAAAENTDNKYEKVAKDKNEEMELEPIELSAYGEEIGVTLKQPIYKEFAANGKIMIEGEIDKSAELKSNYIWIKIYTSKEGPAGKQHEYYVPIKDGKFKESIHLFNGEGEYKVTVQVPSLDRENYYYDTAVFNVMNVNPEQRRDVAYSPFGQEAELSIDADTSYVKKDGLFKLKGTAGNLTGNEEIMIVLSKDSQQWKHVISAKKGKFEYDVPLFYGKGLHKLEVMVPDKDREKYYQTATTLLIDNESSREMLPIEYTTAYLERGVILKEPMFGGDEADITYEVKGSIDPKAEFADKTTHLYIEIKKGKDKALEVIPVENFKFDDSFYLRFGPGKYEVTVNVPEIKEMNSIHYRYFTVAKFEVESKSDSDLRDILPSRGVQSDAPEIKKLAKSLVQGKNTDMEKTKAIYDYVAQNVAYDVQKYRNSDFNWDDSALKTLESKLGVCQDSAYLAIALLRASDIEARYIEGYGNFVRHAWVEANVDGRWLTMDPTWGAGYLKNDQFVKNYTDKYFDPNMAEFKKTHSRIGVVY